MKRLLACSRVGLLVSVGLVLLPALGAEGGLPYLNAVWVEAKPGGEHLLHAVLDVGEVTSPRLDLALQFRVADAGGAAVRDRGSGKALLLWPATWDREAAGGSPVWRPSPVPLSAGFFRDRADLGVGTHVVEAGFDVFDPSAGKYVEAGWYWRATFRYTVGAEGASVLEVLEPGDSFPERDVARMPPPPVVRRVRQDLREEDIPPALGDLALRATRVLGSLRFRAGPTAQSVAFASHGHALLTWGETGKVQVWEAATGEPRRLLPGIVVDSADGEALVLSGPRMLDPLAGSSRGRLDPEPIGPLAARWMSGGSTLLVATATEVLTYDGASGALARRTPLAVVPGAGVEGESDPTPIAVRIEPSGRYLVRTWPEGKRFGMDVLDVATGNLAVRTHAVFGAPPLLVVLSDGGTLASSSYEWTEGGNGLALFDAATGRKRSDIPGTSDLRALALSPDGNLLAAGGGEGVTLHDPATGSLRRRLPVEGAVEQLGFSPDGAVLWANGRYGLASFDVATGERLGRPPFAGPTATGPSGPIAITLGEDEVLRAWDLRTGRVTSDTPTYTAFVLSRDGSRAAAEDAGGRVRVWDTTTGKDLLTLVATRGPLTLSPDGRLLAAGLHGTAPLLWDVDRGEVVFAPREREGTGYLPAFSADGRHVAVPWSDQIVRIYDLATHRMVVGGALTTSVSAYAFSPDGTRLCLVAQYGLVRAEVAAGAEFRQIARCSYATALAWLPDGRRVVSCAEPPEVFDATTGESLLRFPGEPLYRPEFAVSPDGSRIAATPDGGSLIVFDAADGRRLWTLRGPLRVQAAAFGADGKTLHTVVEHGAVVTWSLE